MNRRLQAAVEAMSGSTETLLRSIADLTDEQAREPSLLPGWTRGHVLTHLARNADGLGNLLAWARTGVETPMYESRERRAADIEAGADRTALHLVRDVIDSSERLADAIAELPDGAWENQIQWGKEGRESPAHVIPTLRRIEVEIHHVDLDLDYTLAHLPSDFVLWMIERTVRDLSERDDLDGFVLVGNENEGRWVVGAGGAEITGTPASLLGWLIGRTNGIGLHSDTALPELGPWR